MSSSVGSGPGAGAEVLASAARSANRLASSQTFLRAFSTASALRRSLGSARSTSTYADGSSTICAKITARAAASGRRAHHRCSVLGCPWRIDFSRALALLMASSGRATSMSFFFGAAVMAVYRFSEFE